MSYTHIRYINDKGTCVICPPGHYCQSGIIPCPIGTYSTGGKAKCRKCPVGTYGSKVAAESEADCSSCCSNCNDSNPAAQSFSRPGSSSCTECHKFLDQEGVHSCHYKTAVILECKEGLYVTYIAWLLSVLLTLY